MELIGLCNCSGALKMPLKILELDVTNQTGKSFFIAHKFSLEAKLSFLFVIIPRISQLSVT